ncbi:MAG: TlpA family protein disulfide reductase [Actinomycetota bacterium]
MTNLLIVAGVVVCATAAAIIGRRRRPQVPTQPRMQVPSQVDRNDFAGPRADWLVAVFSSATCHTCADVVRKAKALASRDVVVHDVEYSAARDIHRRYDIDAVPVVLIVDRDGVVRANFMGPVTATDLWAAVAECREPGSRPNASCEKHND